MPLLDLRKLTTGLSPAWAGYLRDWDRSLRAGNYPETTRYNYLLAATQLGRYLAEHSPDPDAPDAAADPAEVTKAHVEAFQAWMIATRSAATALNKHKAMLLLGWTSEDMPRHYGASAAAELAQQIGELVEPGNDVCGQADAGHDHRDRFRSWRWSRATLRIAKQLVASSTPSATPSPSWSCPRGVDPCLIGTWRITGDQVWGLIDGVRVLYSGGAGVRVTYRADCTTVIDFSAIQPRVATYRGATWTDVQRGAVTGTCFAENGTLTTTATSSDAVDTLRRNGKVNATAPVTFYPEPTQYRCIGDELRTYSAQGNFSTQASRQVGASN